MTKTHSGVTNKQAQTPQPLIKETLETHEKKSGDSIKNCEILFFSRSRLNKPLFHPGKSLLKNHHLFSMVGEMVQNSQSLYSFTFNALIGYSRIYLFTFNNRIYIQEIYLFTFTCVFLIHDYICSHLRDVFIHIQRVISIHIHDRNIHSTFSAHQLCASVSIKHGLRSTDYGLRTGYKTQTGYKTRTQV